jgi:hypothetical protein
VPLTRAIGVVLVTAACAQPDGGDVEHAEASVSVDPPSVYFGVVQWGETATQELSLTNDGETTAEVTLVDPSKGLTIDDAGPFTIEPGATSTREIGWTPTTFEGLSTRFEVLGPDGPYTALSVTGGTVYPIVDASTFEPYDYGAVPLGCAPAVPLRIVNEGLGDLVLSALPEAGFYVRDESGRSLETPFVLAPRSSTHLEVAFGPLETGAADAVLALTTNDPSLPLLELDVRGEGVANERETAEWMAGLEPVTILVQVNAEVLLRTTTEQMDAFLWSFFETLNGANATYRVAFVIHTVEVDGAVAYIDDSFTSAEAMDAAHAMLASPAGDNDAGLETCLQFVAATDWAVAGSDWPNPKLNAVVINTDAEQSPGNAAYYVEHLRDAWGSPNFAVHGVAGDVPYGCTMGGAKNGGGLTVVPSPVLEGAARATGGVFLSICDPDWAHTGATLAKECAKWPGFVFPGLVGPAGIDVYVDDVVQTSGWSYDRASNAIVFEDASRPPDGAVVRAEYYAGDVCE